MKTMYLGEAVRRQRIKLGLSQEMVCAGLCTTMTLSRFEKGQQTPSRDCVVAILQRLGLPDDRYYAQLTRREIQLIRLRKEVLAYCIQFEHTQGEARQQIRINAMKKLRDLELHIRADDNINQQFVLRIKVTLEIYPPQKQLELLMEAIRLTSPQFDLDDLSKCLYSMDEVMIINKIALRYALCGQRSKALAIYKQLLNLILKQNPNHMRLHIIAYNYALNLASEKQLEEALEISALGRQACIRRGYYRILPRFSHIEAECYYLMGRIDKSMESYRSAYYIYSANLDTRNQEIMKTDVKERFNLEL